MKHLLILLSLLPTILHAQTLTAPSMAELRQELAKARFSPRGRGKIFGYTTTQSCLYASEKVLVLKHYCYPVRPYPARGYTIISRNLGMIDLYQETFEQVQKRDILVSQFPEILAEYLNDEEATVKSLSALIEKLYYKNHPACWSSNAGDASGEAEANCNVSSSTLTRIDEWFAETQGIVSKAERWDELLNELDGALVRVD